MIFFVTNFSEWIIGELNSRGWSRSEAARRGKISPSMMDKVITGSSEPGLVFYRGIAKAFEMTLIQVLEKAGEYTPGPNRSEWDNIFDTFSQEDQQELLAIARLKAARKK